MLISLSTAHDMCLCQTHANFISLTNALLQPYNRQWSVENAVCRFEEGCNLNQCETCKDDTKLKEALQGKQESGDKIEVSRWQKATAAQIAKLHWPNDGSHWLQLALACQQWANEVYRLVYQTGLPMSCHRVAS